ncbi:hypothetical protein AVEN_137297-1 [Araneus ventricosus]|uniref:Endonuclease/exonuclease/phosphatase domain-containing protein n=1 Tax=Araneus ventricosus TaxID=182803 RepID=A0A4Y2MR38_ARAVE|nr:hypothetical protein AVEN_137297-1 [Araneus ventricosus]
MEHWVLSIAPTIFKTIKDLKWLSCGFGSYKFKEHLEPLRCFNCHRSRLATQELKHAFPNEPPDVYIIQEPYKKKGKIFGFPLCWKIVTADPDGKTIIAIRNKNIGVVVRHTSQNIVAVELSEDHESLTVFSIYFSPSTNKTAAIINLEEVIASISTQKFIIAGDINMRNELWGPVIFDHRAQDNGGPFVDFVLKHNLDFHNNPTSEPTFEGPREYHIHQLQNCLQVEEFIDSITKLIQQACTITTINGNHANAPWWDSELDIQRKRTRALRARFPTCKNSLERTKRREIYKKEEARYKWLLKSKARASFEELCTRITKNNPFELPYKLAANKIKKQLMLHSVNTTNGVKTKDLQSTVEVIVKSLFPDDLEEDESQWHQNVRNFIEHVTLNNSDQIFTAPEISQVIKIMPKKKAPGTDGISIEIIKALNNACPELLQGIFNKCLQIGFSPKLGKLQN